MAHDSGFDASKDNHYEALLFGKLIWLRGTSIIAGVTIQTGELPGDRFPCMFMVVSVRLLTNGL